jgi:hypothetical protein
MVIISG